MQIQIILSTQSLWDVHMCSACLRAWLYGTRWPGKQADSENGPAYFHGLLPVNWKLILHGSELAQ